MHGFEARGEQLVGRGRFRESGRFGRMFPLKSLAEFQPGPDVLGAANGPMDAGSGGGQDNPRIKAGYTFLGQFIDHDVTLDVTSDLEQIADPDAIENFRTPALELDSVYGMGPGVQPHLYDNQSFGKLLVSQNGEDLQRNRQCVAIIGDPRNEENLIIAQLHLLFIKFHNKVMDFLEATHPDPRQRFAAAQQLVRWHYQWIVVNEFLPRTIGSSRTSRIFAHPVSVPEERPYMPVEFSVACYRFGHSQVRGGYRMGASGVALFPAPGAPQAPHVGLPDSPCEAAADQPPTTDLRGFRPIPQDVRINWANFFGPSAQASLFIDTKLSSSLLNLPNGVVPPATPAANRSLAIRNLKRGISMQLPSGQDLSGALAIPPMSDQEVWSGVVGGSGPAPLWFYILKEAEIRGRGLRLAGVGAEVVGIVFRMLLAGDAQSYLIREPLWTPTLPSDTAGKFTMSDLINFTLGTNVGQEDLPSLPDVNEELADIT